MTKTFAIVIEIEPHYDDEDMAGEFFQSVVSVVEEFTAWASLKNSYVRSSPAVLDIDSNGYVVVRMDLAGLV